MARSLQERLQASLGSSVLLHVHHFCALPTSTDPLFVAPVGQAPEPTELESHFLSVSVKYTEGLVQVFAIEILIYFTADLTTLFVSKADSTGFLYLLELPKSSPSPIQVTTVEFLSYLVESKQASHRRLVLSLFARAQDQYLFPGSIENEKKHVLDDRGLIKWWAKLLDKTLGAVDKYVCEASKDDTTKAADIQVRAHVVVPGCDKHETRGFIPRDERYQMSQFWHVGDPLDSLGKASGTPERCLIPRFPDDPKARFAIDLDDELPDQPTENKPEGDIDAEIPAVKISDRWRSVRTLAQFWELMSFRQECSAGRLVGFLWAIWEPSDLAAKVCENTFQSTLVEALETDKPAQSSNIAANPLLQEQHLVSVPVEHFEAALPSVPKPPTGLVSSNDAPPQVQEPAPTSSTSTVPPIDVVKETAAPPLLKRTGAEITLAPDAYSRCMALLLTLDYCDLKMALQSSKSFLDAALKESGKESWGVEVKGTKESNGLSKVASDSGTANSLAGLIRKRSKNEEATTLSLELIRKKPKP